MAIVRTVTGDVEAGQVGPTTMHEHIFGDFTVWQEDPKLTASLVSVAVDPNARVEMGILGVIHRNPVVIRDNLRIGDDEALALAEVRKFADAGGDCLVEVTCCGDVAADGVTNMGRNAPGLRRIAEKTGLKIVAGTGFYLEGTHPDYVRTDSVEELAARMIRDIIRAADHNGGSGVLGDHPGDRRSAWPVSARRISVPGLCITGPNPTLPKGRSLSRERGRGRR